MIHNSIIEAIGNTPIVRLNRVAENVEANLYAKLEFTNPGGSIKDRIGFWMIEDAEKKGYAETRRHDYRGHQRQHRGGAGDGGGHQGLQVRFHFAG